MFEVFFNWKCKPLIFQTLKQRNYKSIFADEDLIWIMIYIVISCVSRWMSCKHSILSQNHSVRVCNWSKWPYIEREFSAVTPRFPSDYLIQTSELCPCSHFLSVGDNVSIVMYIRQDQHIYHFLHNNRQYSSSLRRVINFFQMKCIFDDNLH